MTQRARVRPGALSRPFLMPVARQWVGPMDAPDKEPLMPKYECVKQTKRPFKDAKGGSFDAYRYCFKPISGEAAPFTSSPGG